MNINTIIEKYNNGEYRNNLPYPSRPGKKATVEQVQKYNNAKEAYNTEENKKCQEFVKDLHDCFPELSDKQFNVLFAKAWESGHSSGYYQVAYDFDELESFITEFNNAK